nr:fumarate hydratase [Candidatus Bathyarchaeota archaeon]
MPVELSTPISEEDVRRLKVGDEIYVTGLMVTARDEAHKRALELLEQGGKLPVDLEGLVLYHCGPVVKKKGEGWTVIAAGPTTSARLEMFEPSFIEKFKVRVIVGKGGMGDKTAEACRKHGCVYTAFTGGAALIASSAIKRVVGVEWLDLGVPEALWIFEVERFGPLIVTIDTSGENLFRNVMSQAREKFREVITSLGKP